MTVRIGSGCGWSRDQFHPGEQLLKEGQLDYVVFDSMSEITMSAAQVARESDDRLPGYDPYLLRRLGPLLADAKRSRTRLISNQGWLDPEAAGTALAAEARRQGLHLRIATVTGGTLTARLCELGLCSAETGEPFGEMGDRVVSAEAYLGAFQIRDALLAGADVVLTPRVTDASLVLGPLMAEHGWQEDDWQHLGWGIGIGHIIECGGQVTGGYFADPGYKEVPNLADLGYPIAEIDADSAVITKLDGTGGLVTEATLKEQLLYEVGDPASYMNADVVADLSGLRFRQAGPDRVEVTGGAGRPAPETLKVLVGVREGFTAEEMMSFAGPGAFERAELARSVVETRLKRAGLQAEDFRVDYVGINSVHREASPQPIPTDRYEYVVRFAARTSTRQEAEKLRYEIDPMATSGPASTGKWATMGSRVRPVIGLHSTHVSRADVDVAVSYRDS